MRRILALAVVLLSAVAASAWAATGAATSAGDSAELRIAAAASPTIGAQAWRAWLADQLAETTAWAAASHDDPSWLGGWPHDHVDPVTGRFRTWTPTTPKPSEALNQGKVASGWVAITREYNLRQILRAARLGVLTGRPELLAWARRELGVYADLYPKQAVRGLRERSVLFTESLQEAVVLPSLLEAIRLLGPGSKADELRLWRDGLITPMVDNLMRSQHQVNNKSVWRTAAIALAGQQYGQPQWVQFAREGPWSFKAMLGQGLAEDGHWFELSTQYHEYVLRALLEYLAGMRELGAGAETDPSAKAAAISMFHALYQIRLQNGEGPLTNDGTPGRQVPTDATLAWAARALPGEWAKTGSRPKSPTWEHLLSPPPPAVPSAWQPRAADWQGAEWIAGLKTLQIAQGPWRGVLRAGQRAKFHAHQDALSIELMVGDQWVFRNPGTLGYGAAIHQNYLKKAVAHSSPLINGLGDGNWFRDPSATVVSAQEVKASVDDFRPGVNVTRTLQATATSWRDDTTFAGGGAGRGAMLVYHTPCQVAAPGGRALPVADRAGGALPTWSTDAPVRQGLSFDGELRLELRCGPRLLLATLRTTGPSRLLLGASPGGPTGGPERTALWIVLPEQPAPSLRLGLQLAPATR